MPGDIPGSIKRKVHLSKYWTHYGHYNYNPFQNPFFINSNYCYNLLSLLSVYGFRASLVSFSGLLAMVAIKKKQRMKLWFKLNGVGLWYLVVSFIFENLFYKRPESVTIRYTSSYW
jgi:hypothetical protein